MSKKIIKSAIKIIVGVLSCFIIAFVVMDQFGIIDEIKQMQQMNKVKKNNGVWKSKVLGDGYIEICDGAVNDEPDWVGVSLRSAKHQNSSDIGTYARIKEDLHNIKYEKIQVNNYCEQAIHSDYLFYYCYVPKDCDYMTVGKKKVEIQEGSIDTVKHGKVEFRMVLFGGKYKFGYDLIAKQKIQFHTKSGKVYQYSRYEGEGKWL